MKITPTNFETTKISQQQMSNVKVNVKLNVNSNVNGNDIATSWQFTFQYEATSCCLGNHKSSTH